ncbi:MAG: hypothetical protein E3J90_12950 [Promethearchaeota archaeon]|nr:MAG: hypothetical protein E3J90_12950 [Candidatus Lokiarchaeota archaeon]
MKSKIKLGLGLVLIIFTLITLIVWCVFVFSYFHAPQPCLACILGMGFIYFYSFIVFILIAFGMRLLLGSLPSIKKRANVSIISSSIFLVFSIFIYLIILNRYYDQLPDYLYPVSFQLYTFSPLIGIDFLSICLVIYGIVMIFKREPKTS